MVAAPGGSSASARDDVIDAAVLLLAARCWSECSAVPDAAPRDPAGLPMAIHFLDTFPPETGRSSSEY